MVGEGWGAEVYIQMISLKWHVFNFQYQVGVYSKSVLYANKIEITEIIARV
jgi:hypothetical protein